MIWAKPTPDENTIRSFRERLTKTGASRRLFLDFDRQLHRAGCPAMGGQIVDATLVSAPRQRNTADEKAASKDVDARWTVKIGRPRHKTVERSVPELAIPVFG